MQITCPNCKVTYAVDKCEDSPIVCLDCGAWYSQRTHSNSVIPWVRDKILSVKGE